jgi:hypothetical protein
VRRRGASASDARLAQPITAGRPSRRQPTPRPISSSPVPHVPLHVRMSCIASSSVRSMRHAADAPRRKGQTGSRAVRSYRRGDNPARDRSVGAKRRSAAPKVADHSVISPKCVQHPTAASHRFQFSGPAQQTGVTISAGREPSPAEAVSKLKIRRFSGVALPFPRFREADRGRSGGSTSSLNDSGARFDTASANTGRRQAPAPDLQTCRQRARVTADARVIRASRFQRTRLERRGEIFYS